MDTKQLLRESFEAYIKTGSFFDKWFKQHSRPYYFTFKLDLSRTNIQYGELKALLKSNISDENGDKSFGKRLQIHTVGMINHSIHKMISAFNFPIHKYRQNLESDPLSIKYKYELEKLLDVLVANYFDILTSTIVLDPLHCSCCLFVPPNAKVNIVNIMACGGYLNTCGELIYIRNFNKANKEIFYKALDNSLGLSETKIDFNIFSHEDFTHTISQQHNYEKLKIHLDKFYFDTTPLSAVLVELQEKFKDKLDVLIFFNNSKRRSSKNSFWMVKDASISENIKVPGDDNYFICFKQLLKNDNQLQIFNENKPAWKSNTSIPHTLIGAMINLAFEDLHYKEGKIVAVDPFAGTGTTVLELIKLTGNYNIDIYGSDLDESFPILFEDNRKIVAMDATNLKKLIKKLKNRTELTKDYHKLLENIEELNLSRENEEFEIPKNKIKKFKKLTLTERLFIYTYFIVRISYANEIERKNTIFKKSYFKEISKLSSRLEGLLESSILEESDQIFDTLNSSFKVVSGRFSDKIILNQECFSQLNIDESKIKGGIDFRLLNENYYDLIIGDPPYGFNIEHGIDNLLKLYSDMAEVFVRAIKRNGQIILSLPDKSYSGKRSPWFTHKEMVLTRFNYEANKQNKKMISFSEIVPTKEIFNPPYYWEAQKALRRSIIQMKFQ